MKTSRIIPWSRYTPYEAKQFEDSVAAAAVARLKSKSPEGDDRIVVRSIMPHTDLSTPTNENFSSPAYTAAASATLVNNVQLPTTKCVAFYGVAVDDAAPGASYITFALGTNAGVDYRFDFEDIYVEQIVKGYFSEAVFFDPQQFMMIQVYARATKAAGEKLYLLGLVAEIRGPNLT